MRASDKIALMIACGWLICCTVTAEIIAVEPASAPSVIAPLVPLVPSALMENEQKDTADQTASTEPENKATEIKSKKLDATKGLEFGYDNGFFFSSPNDIKFRDKTVPFLLKINSWFQFRHTYFDSHNNNQDQNDFEFERLRLVFSGHAYTPDLTYFMQLDGDSDQFETADFLDYFIKYDFGHDQLDLNEGSLGLRVGKWKMPFNRARAESGSMMQFSDRSMASSLFDINRSIGLALYGATPVFDGEVNWEVALNNGLNTGAYRPSRQAELDRNFGVSGRIFSDLVGEWGKDGEPDLTPHKCPAIRFGAGFAATRVDEEGPREFNIQRVVDSGAQLSNLIPAAVTAYNVQMYAVDANFKYQGFSLLSEFYFRNINEFSGAPVRDLFDHGLLVQSGYFLVPEKFEVISRYSRIVGNSGTLGVSNQSADEVALGAVWYIKGHNAKLSFDATRLNGAPIQDSALNIHPGDDGMLYRTQLQLSF